MSLKKILFITNKFPPASCGVGDYTYKLAQELIQQGQDVDILCSCNSKIIDRIDDFKEEGIKVWPIVKSWNKSGLNALVEDFSTTKYDWVSLQYVPFSFQAKGIPLGLAQGLKFLFPNVKWNIMFHELWVGKVSNASLRLKIQGYIQRTLIKNMIAILKPEVVHSHSEIYIYQLTQIDVAAKKLPLFSNIERHQSQGETVRDTEKVVFSIFGGIINGAPVQEFIADLNTLFSQERNKKIRFNFIGSNGGHINVWINELERHGISYDISGFLPEDKVSELLEQSDYGITTTPYLLTEKSGAVAAMKQHRLKIICVARNWQLPNFDKSKIEGRMIKEFQKGHLNEVFSTDWGFLDYRDVNEIGLQFVNDLNKK